VSKIAEVTQEQTRKRLALARRALKREMRVVKDLVFFKTHTGLGLSPRQTQDLERAIRMASEVVALCANDYAKAAIELIASNPK
jgi:hypothetical protein